MTMQNTAAIIAATAPSAIAERASLTRALDIVANVIERRNTIPILSNCRIQGDGQTLFVTGTDIDIELVVALPAAADSRLDTSVPAHGFRDFLKKATASDFVAITHEHDDSRDNVNLDFERVNYTLQALPGSDFPTLRGPSLIDFGGKPDSAYRNFRMTGPAFLDGINSVMGAMSSEETRYYLNGMFFHEYQNEFVMVATDGHRLYRRVMALPEGAAAMPGVIIPRKTIALLHKLLKGKACPDHVDIEVTEANARITWGDPDFHVTITTKLVDGTFPDYNRVIPTGNDKVAVFDADTLAEAVRAVSLVSSERGRAVKFQMSKDNAALTVNNPDAGSAHADVACSYDSYPLEIGFNASYFADMIAVGAGKGEPITAKFSDSGSPALFTGSIEGWTGVLMPMRV
ncbi:DNA polymerase III subunit beta [Hoeflea sp.]|uniref:DNA polymerase III subunit beta n=1 Tax=Hoeflea sp. TaxID=1940281 RepID=UPI003B51C36C